MRSFLTLENSASPKSSRKMSVFGRVSKELCLLFADLTTETNYQFLPLAAPSINNCNCGDCPASSYKQMIDFVMQEICEIEGNILIDASFFIF